MNTMLPPWPPSQFDGHLPHPSQPPPPSPPPSPPPPPPGPPSPPSSRCNKCKKGTDEEHVHDTSEPGGNSNTNDGDRKKRKRKKKSTNKESAPWASTSSGQQEHQQTETPEASTRKKQKGKVVNEVYRVSRRDLKEDATGGAERLRNGIVIHVRAFMGAFKAGTIPDPPTSAEIAAFKQSQSLGSDPHAALKRSLTTINTSSINILNQLRTLREECKLAGSTTASKIAQIPDDKIKMMFACLQESLHCFCPDVFGTPTSYYNLVHEGLVMITFTQVYSLSGYRFLGIEKEYVDNTLLVQKLYRSFVFSRMRKLMRREAKQKGGVQEDLNYTKVYKERRNFNPDEFNKLPVHIRVKYRDSSVVLPLAEKMAGPEDDWKTMGHKGFMKKYGKEVCSQYQIPTKEEMESADVDTDDEMDEDEGDESDGSEMDES
ncbi:uncharacterized protein C8R40DRAFT_1177305 [Lentinula edodes]|uniref:uncharacterized protein n=1 Tax=Lentinula edodes TaxID=5353 RepID=UPI001E8DE64E|nr:uncharacterized protein C8R40DRAFT_1177305 [Lentinula edodes]KAH7868866.1 hypothetical protein C8R40DRAFT_1177305 [Lentinula edodes]